jgi:excisionase family DNA binding protein
MSELREPAIDALAEALDRAIEGLTTARRILASAQRAPATRHRPSRATRAREVESPLKRALRDGVPVVSRPLDETSVTVAEAADMLELSQEQVRRLLRSGELVGIPFGGRHGWRLSREYVEEEAARRRAASPRARERELQPG